MLYFSQTKNAALFDKNSKKLGKIIDILFLNTETPLITTFVVQNDIQKTFYVPAKHIVKQNNMFTLTKPEEFLKEKKENELSVKKQILDQQIIDIKGNKVVRVNDVAIQDKAGESMYIAGVDVGVRGILRWLGLEQPALPLYKLLGLASRPHFLPWSDFEPLELQNGKVQLKKDLTNLKKIRPEDLADYLEKTNIKNINTVITNLDDEYAADVIGDLNANFQTALFRRFSNEKAAKLIELIDPDDAVDILLTLPKEKQNEILANVTEKKKRKILSLLKLSGTPIGELIVSGFMKVPPDISVADATQIVKEKIADAQFTNYLYVVNDDKQLLGIIDISELFRKDQQERIANIMEQELLVVHLTTPLEIAIKRMLKYKITALPVVDNTKHLLGIITFNDVAETILEEI